MRFKKYTSTVLFFLCTGLQTMNLKKNFIQSQEEDEEFSPILCLSTTSHFITMLFEPCMPLQPTIITKIVYGEPECAICTEGYIYNQELYQTPCGHIFDQQCLDQCLLKYDKCPLCNRLEIKKLLERVIYQPIE